MPVIGVKWNSRLTGGQLHVYFPKASKSIDGPLGRFNPGDEYENWKEWIYIYLEMEQIFSGNVQIFVAVIYILYSISCVEIVLLFTGM